MQARRCECDLDNPDKDTEIPHGFTEHPDRPWTEDDEEQLLDRIESGERNFAKIGQQMQRTEDECHPKYRYLACLEVKEPRLSAWSSEQDAMLVRFAEEYKITDWDRIAFHCGTTSEAARRHWESRKPAISDQSVKRNDLSTMSRLTFKSATSDAMMTALGDIFDQGDREKGRPLSPAVTKDPCHKGPIDDKIPAQMSPKPKLQQPEARTSDGALSSDIQEKSVASLASNVAAGVRKRPRAEDDDIDEPADVVKQPKRKARRTQTSMTTSTIRNARSAPDQVLRRSTRCGKGERKQHSGFFWYDPQKTKAPSRNAMSNDPSSLLVAKAVQSQGGQALVSGKNIRVSTTVRTADEQASGSPAPLGSEAKHGTKRPHMDNGEGEDEETREPKMRCTGFPKVIIRVPKPASAAPSLPVIQPPGHSSKSIEQKAGGFQESATRTGSGSETIGNVRKRRRQAYQEAEGRETLAEEVEENRLVAPQNEGFGNASEGLQGRNKGKGQTKSQTMTAVKIVGRAQKRIRNAGSDVEHGSHRNLRTKNLRPTGHSGEVTASEMAKSVTIAPHEFVGSSSSRLQNKGPPIQPWKLRKRAG